MKIVASTIKGDITEDREAVLKFIDYLTSLAIPMGDQMNQLLETRRQLETLVGIREYSEDELRGETKD